MSARYRCMTSSVHICLTVVTGFLIAIFNRNQLQRSPSTETLCAREVHRMVLGGLNVQILHQKMLYTSYMFKWNEAKPLKILFTYFQIYANFDLPWSVSKQGPHHPHLSTLTNRLQWHLSYLREIWFLYPKFFFPKLQKSEEILQIRKKMKFSFSEFRKNRFDNFTKSI